MESNSTLPVCVLSASGRQSVYENDHALYLFDKYMNNSVRSSRRSRRKKKKEIGRPPTLWDFINIKLN